MIYAGFWRRFAAFWIDAIVLSPFAALAWWGEAHYRLFYIYYFLPETAFGIIYGVCLVKQFGGTPGKRLMNLRIVKVGGGAVSYREAFLRYLPEWAMTVGSSIAMMIAIVGLSDAQYFAPSTFIARTELIRASAPSRRTYVDITMEIWLYSEFIVMFTNKKRRAIHDFIAGTVVIKDMHRLTLRTNRKLENNAMEQST